MTVRRSAVLAAMTSLVLLPAMAEASSGCWYPNEARAAQLRDLQTKLMVGTLHCRKSTPAVVDHYNAFVSNKLQLIETNNRILKRRFDREGGGDLGDGQSSYDRHHTEAANYYSASSSEYGLADCRRIISLSRIAAQMSDPDLLTLADTIVDAPPSGACGPSNYSFDDPAATSVSVARATQSGAAPVRLMEGLSADEMDAFAPATASATVSDQIATSPAETKFEKVAAVMESKTAPPGVSSADALQAAVVALQAATTALQAVATSVPDRNAATAGVEASAAQGQGSTTGVE